MLDSQGRSTTMEYDKLSRIVKQTDAQGQAVSFTYDAVGNVLSIRDPRGKTTTFTYDGMNRVKTRTDFTGKADSRSYDGNGNLVSYTDRRGLTSTFVYDEVNRLKEERYADGSVVKRSYDVRGRLVRVEDTAGGIFTYEYDATGQLTKSTQPTGAITYAHDDIGRVTRRQVVGGSSVDYSYDAVGNLLSSSAGAASINVTYDAGNQPLTLSRPNGTTSSFAFDPVGRLLSIVHSAGAQTLESMSYQYNPVGQRISQQTTAAQALTTPAALATFDDANRLVQRDGTNFSYDENGNLVSESGPNGSLTYTWDSRNRLASVASSDGQRTDFTYDFEGNLIRATDSGPALNRVRSFVLDDLTNVAQQTSSDGNTFSVLTGQAVDSHFATLRANGEVEYALADSLNSTVSTVDQTGAVKSRFKYEPYGETTRSGTDFPFQFTGRVPVSSRLYYYRARYYDTQTGRFLSEDPAGFAGGINQYAYVSDNPTNLNDPSGQCPWCIGAAIGFGFDLASQLISNGGNWRCINLGQLAASTALGALGGGLGGRGLTSALRGLSNGAKGAIGETLSLVENRLAGSTLVETQTRSLANQGLRTVVDSTWRSASRGMYYVESKFGTSGLTKAQQAAQAAMGDAYQVERWGYPFFERVGAYAGGAAGAAAGSGGGGGGGGDCGCK